MAEIERAWINPSPKPPWIENYKSTMFAVTQGAFTLGAILGLLIFLFGGFDPNALFVVGVGIAGAGGTKIIGRHL